MSERVPLPMASIAPSDVTETEETAKPKQMIRMARAPLAMVSGLSVNRLINVPGIHRQSAMPDNRMIRMIPRAVRYIFLTRSFSPAPKL